VKSARPENIALLKLANLNVAEVKKALEENVAEVKSVGPENVAEVKRA
jgi:hypothetical protein